MISEESALLIALSMPDAELGEHVDHPDFGLAVERVAWSDLAGVSFRGGVDGVRDRCVTSALASAAPLGLADLRGVFPGHRCARPGLP